jgi:flagellar biosynthetic protein FliP
MIMKKFSKKYAYRLFGLFLGIFIIVLLNPNTAYATTTTTTTTEDGTTNTTSSNLDTLSPNNTVGGLNITYSNNGEGGLSANIKILLFLTIISLAPSILILMTSFTRIIIVLHFTRAALNTQTAPPNQVLVGLALFLTLFIMGPIFTQINDTAIKPLDAGEITQEQALEIGLKPLREFMFEQTQTKDIKLFLEIAQITDVEEQEDIPITVLIPSFIISELRSAFIMGFLIYIPFIIIDMVVASTLMSMGMMMLPPTTISMPFKILLFVLADGWNLIIGNLVKTFY